MQLTEHFNSDEFTCKCGCGFDAVSSDLVDGLEKLRDKIGSPLIITSGCRCKKHNATIGGSPKSQHLYGRAADVRCPSGMTSAQFAKVAEDTKCFDGIGVYKSKNIIHVDTRGTKARWVM